LVVDLRLDSGPFSLFDKFLIFDLVSALLGVNLLTGSHGVIIDFMKVFWSAKFDQTIRTLSLVLLLDLEHSFHNVEGVESRNWNFVFVHGGNEREDLYPVLPLLFVHAVEGKSTINHDHVEHVAPLY
jgi:hypothetical protein